MGKKRTKVIVADADVIIHFIKANEIYSINSIFDFEIHVLDKVYNELTKQRHWEKIIDNLIAQKILKKINFPEDNQNIKKEYFYIKKQLTKGDGESACLAYVRYTENVLASSNLRDIKHYCDFHKIPFLSTMDFLCCALEKGVFDKDRCNNFINNVKSKGSKLPVNKIEDYKCTRVYSDL